MPTIVIYFDEPGMLDYPLNYTIYYESYRWFAELCEREGVICRFARGDSYQGNLVFSNGYRYENGTLVAHSEPITADVVYVKGLGPGFKADVPSKIVDNPLFEDVTADKWQTYQRLPDLMAPTYQINNENWQLVVTQIPTDRIVLKPQVGGAGGRGVLILDKGTLDFPSLNLQELYLAQPFVDTSGGIEGITPGLHDLRIILFDEIPRLAYLRIPKSGSLLSNISQGASAEAVDISRIPQHVLDICAEVSRRFSDIQPKFYSVDFLFDHGKPYVAELNTRPGFPHPINEGAAFTEEFHRRLLAFLLRIAATPTN